MVFGDNGYDHIYHHHNMKCAGTTLNRFLDLQVPFASCQQATALATREAWLKRVAESPLRGDTHIIRNDHFFRHHFDQFRILHDHATLTPFTKGKAYTFTVLRNPKSRLISFYSFCRKMALLYVDQGMPMLHDHFVLAHNSSLSGFLTLNRNHTNVDNYLVRSLACLTINDSQQGYVASATLLPFAIRNLAHRVDRVLIQESLDAGIEQVCEDLGLCPQEQVGVTNTTRASRNKSLSAKSEAIMEACTRFDRQLYDYAVELVAMRDRERAGRYTRDVFERKFVAQRLATLTPIHDRQGIFHDLSGPLIGYGFWGRDAGGTPDVSAWSGPGTACGLYLNVPKGERIQIVLELSGFAGPEIDKISKIEVDDRPRAFEHRVVDNIHYVEIPVIPTRDFAHVRIELPTTVTLGSGEDARACGLLLKRFGWVPSPFPDVSTKSMVDKLLQPERLRGLGIPASMRAASLSETVV